MRIVAPRNLFIEFMVMVYCFIWLNRQAEASQKATAWSKPTISEHQGKWMDEVRSATRLPIERTQ